MQVTAELLEKDIENLKNQKANMIASVAQVTGSILALEGVLSYVKKTEEEAVAEKATADNLKISRENAEVQAAENMRQEALSLSQVAEAFAGPGATAEEPVALAETNPNVVKISDGVRMVADGHGQYKPVPMEEVEA